MTVIRYVCHRYSITHHFAYLICIFFLSVGKPCALPSLHNHLEEKKGASFYQHLSPPPPPALPPWGEKGSHVGIATKDKVGTTAPPPPEARTSRKKLMLTVNSSLGKWMGWREVIMELSVRPSVQAWRMNHDLLEMYVIYCTVLF